LHGLATNDDDRFSPSDVQRVTEIHDKPQFFVDGADSNDIVQGSLGDCWFLSALATMSTSQGLIEKFCVAVRFFFELVYRTSLKYIHLQRDEQVGVYGFIFFRDTAWVVIIIDEYIFILP
jgi:hypothetical protein